MDKELELVSEEQTRIRVSFKVSAKGDFQPDVTSEAEKVETAITNLDSAYQELMSWAQGKGLLK